MGLLRRVKAKEMKRKGPLIKAKVADVPFPVLGHYDAVARLFGPGTGSATQGGKKNNVVEEGARAVTCVPVFKIFGDGNCAPRAVNQWEADPERQKRYVKSTGLPWSKDEKVRVFSKRPPSFITPIP